MDCNKDYINSDAEAMYSVGKRFLQGDCLEKDIVKARDLLSRAAALGHRRAQERYIMPPILSSLSGSMQPRTKSRSTTS